MRTPILAGNWKMHKTVDEALALVNAIKGPLADITTVDAAVCTPSIALKPVADALSGSNIAVGAQNMY